MPRFSIIVPMYNTQQHICTCLRSIVDQTFQDFEVLIVDDGSSDQSADVVTKFIEGDNRFNLIRQSNQGSAVARNKGLSMAHGDYISFIDADDWIDARLFGHLECFIRSKDSDVIAFQYQKLNSESQSIEPRELTSEGRVFHGERIRDAVLQENAGLIGSVCNKIYRHSMLTSGQLKFRPELRKGQDGVFNLEVFDTADSLLVLSDKLYYYRYVPSSVVNRYRESKLNAYLKHYKIENQVISNWGRLNGDVLYRRNLSLLAMVVDSVRNEFHPDNSKSAGEIIDSIKTICENPNVANAMRSGLSRRFIGLGRTSKQTMRLLSKKRYFQVFVGNRILMPIRRMMRKVGFRI